jgi:hypothetical protein
LQPILEYLPEEARLSEPRVADYQREGNLEATRQRIDETPTQNELLRRSRRVVAERPSVHRDSR